MPHIPRSGSWALGLAVCLATLAVAPARAQYDDDPPPRGYEQEPPPYGERPAYRERRSRPAPRRDAGLNCDAVQEGLSGPQPYSCPLPGPRPLGARCFCDMPLAAFSRPQTAVGRVVP